MKLRAKIYVAIVICSGLLSMGIGITFWQRSAPTLFAAILLLGIASSFLKLTIFGSDGNISMNFIFIMLGVTRLSLGETLCVGVTASLVQIYWHSKKPKKRILVAFNIGLIAAVIGLTYAAYQSAALTALIASPMARLCLISMLYFVLNTGGVAGVISITNGQKPWPTWRDSYVWCYPYYLFGSSTVGIFNFLESTFGLELSLTVLPIAFIAYRSVRMRIEALEKSRIHAEDEKKHAEEVATLHLRTIRALALAIEAKDATTGEHLHRVHTYALALGQHLGLGDEELQALGAASILHDIGKIAVPEYIISKPGKLSKEEFGRMKIHPLVGGEIIESVRFPYAVAPIVSAHHEKWDGTGYPLGLKGKDIPIGARILSAVDCLDALASDRQYRRALPLDQAMAIVQSESGKAFDPAIVDLLSLRYRELEALARSTSKGENLELSLNARIDRGLAPDAGLEIGHLRSSRAGTAHGNAVDLMVHTVKEFRRLDSLDRLLTGPKTAGQLVELLTVELLEAINFDSLALFLASGESLVPFFVTGIEADFLRSLNIPVGTGLSGWVAEYRVPMLNGNPGTEVPPGSVLRPGFMLQSALAIPLENETGVLGVLTLYSKQRDAFQGDDLRLCMGLRSRLTYALEAAMVATAQRAGTGIFPGCDLPNMGALLRHLDGVLGLASEASSLVVLAIRFPSVADPSLVEYIRAFVNALAGGGFLARASDRDLVAVPAHWTAGPSALQVAFADAWMRSGSEQAITFGCAEAPADAIEAESLIAMAASRFQPLAVSYTPQMAAGLSALSRMTNLQSRPKNGTSGMSFEAVVLHDADVAVIQPAS